MLLPTRGRVPFAHPAQRFRPLTTTQVASEHPNQIACHCTDCSHTSGAAYSTNILALKSDVSITGDVKQYDSKAASGNVGTSPPLPVANFIIAR